MAKLQYYFAVFCNGEHKADLETATKTEAKQWIRSNLFSTHMGEWRRCGTDWEYNTTIGRYYSFRKLPRAPKGLAGDWLNWFKLAVTQARDARLKGDIERAVNLDRTLEQYYYRGQQRHGFSEDFLFEIESSIRNGGTDV